MVATKLRQVVLDGESARELAEFYRRLLDWPYRPGDEVPAAGVDDVRGRDWLVLRDPTMDFSLAFQQVPSLPRPTWPEGAYPQMSHLDMTVASTAELIAERDRVLDLGARILRDRFDDPDEPLYVFADPAGHPFCIFVA